MSWVLGAGSVEKREGRVCMTARVGEGKVGGMLVRWLHACGSMVGMGCGFLCGV